MQLSDLTFEYAAPDGTPVTIRPIRPEDREIERQFVESLSDDTRFLRFLSAIKSLSPRLLDRLINIDFPDSMAFIATIRDHGREKEIGVARYAPSDDGAGVEFAVVVADEWHGQGIGRELLRRLFDVAAAAGIRRIEGVVLASNVNMLRFCAGLGFTSRLHEQDGGLVRVFLDLPAAPDSPTAQAAGA